MGKQFIRNREYDLVEASEKKLFVDIKYEEATILPVYIPDKVEIFDSEHDGSQGQRLWLS